MHPSDVFTLDSEIFNITLIPGFIEPGVASAWQERVCNHNL